MVTQQKNLQLIQMMRGIASLLVVLLHITINFSDTLRSSFLFNIFKFGGSGVDIFFVLSGFIITYSNLSLIAKPNAFLKFLKRRFIRIFPVYWIVISFFLLLQILFSSFYNTHFVFNSANLLKTYFLLPEHNMVNGVSWSLTNELFFYLLFTLAIIISNRKFVIYIAGIYFLILLLSGVICCFSGNTNNYLKLFFFPMNIEFLLGVGIALAIEKFSLKWIYPVLLTGIFLFICGAVYRNNNFEFLSEGIDRVILFGFPSFLIIFALVKLELYKNIKVNNIFLHLGDASYSIYLLHLPIVAAFYKIVVKLNLKSILVIYLLSFLLLAGVSLLGIIVYNTVEKPLIKKLNKFF